LVDKKEITMEEYRTILISITLIIAIIGVGYAALSARNPTKN